MKIKLQTLLKHTWRTLLLFLVLFTISQGAFARYGLRGGFNSWGCTEVGSTDNTAIIYKGAASQEFKVSEACSWDKSWGKDGGSISTGSLGLTENKGNVTWSAAVGMYGMKFDGSTVYIWAFNMKSYTTGSQGTKYVGDYVGSSSTADVYYYFGLNTKDWNTAEAVFFKTTSSTQTASATYDSDDDGNKKVKANLKGKQFTSAGTWYVKGRANSHNDATKYGYTNSSDYAAVATSLSANSNGAAYWTVNAVPNPTSLSSSASGTTATVSWTRNSTKTTVMVVRYEGASPTVTPPTNGTSYTAGSSTIGAGTVIYKGTNQTYDDTGRTAGTTYTYYLYTVNNNYYSSGVSTSVTIPTACTQPTVVTNSSASGIGLQTATVKGTITNGTCSVTASGIAYGTSANPTSGVSKSYTSGTEFSATLTGLTPGTKYYYRTYATTASGTVYGTEYNFTTTACSAPSISTHPSTTAQNICINGSSTALSVTATGGVTSYSYQWQSATTSGGTYSDIDGANSSSYTPLTTSAGTKYYRVKVSSASPCASSTVTSNASGAVTVSATSVGGTASATASTVCSGTGTTVSLTGNTGSIQWQKSTTSSSTGFSNISGATSASYSTGNLTQDTWYRAVVTSGACASANSTVAAVAIYAAPTITTQPTASQSVCSGSTPTSISVTASGNSLTYQWQLKTTGDWGDMSGKTSSTLSYGVATTAGTYNYRCVVTDGCGNSVISSTHVLTVNPKPIAGTISGNDSACSGLAGGVSLTLSGHTTTGSTIQWKKKASGDASWSNVSGATSATLSTSQTLETMYRAYVTYTATSCYSYTSNKTVTITPDASIGSVTLSSSSVCIGQGLSATANTVVLGGGEGAWSSTDESVATITSAGVITPKAAGSTNITYTITGGCGGTVSKYATLTVKPNAAAAQYTLSNNTQTYNGASRSVTVTPATGAGVATVYYSSASYAKSTTGPINAGTYTVTVDAAAGTNYCAASDINVGTLTINKANQATLTISNTLTTFAYCSGAHTTLTTSGGSGDGAVTYTITSGSGTIDGSTLTATAKNSITVTATKAASQNYNATTSAGKTFNFTQNPPTAYDISAAVTSICSGGDGTITLANSQTGYNYLLYNNGTPLEEDIKAGTGSAIDFDVTSSGVYTAKGYYGTNRDNCLTDMNETIVMTISTTPKLVRTESSVTNYKPVTITSVNTDIETWTITNEGSTAYAYDKTANAITFKGTSTNSPYTVTATTHGGCSNTTTVTVTADSESCN